MLARLKRSVVQDEESETILTDVVVDEVFDMNQVAEQNVEGLENDEERALEYVYNDLKEIFKAWCTTIRCFLYLELVRSAVASKIIFCPFNRIYTKRQP